MHIILDRQTLVQALAKVSKAVSTRTTIPILTGIKITANEDGCIFTASDSDISIQAYVSTEEGDKEVINVVKIGSIVLPAKYITDIVRKLPDEKVEIDVQDNYITYIRSGQSEFHLNGLDADEYPRLPEVEENQVLRISSKQLQWMIRQTAFAVSTQESRPILSGVLCELVGNEFHMVATDSHRLAKRSITLDTQPDVTFSNVVVPGRALSELSRIVEDSDHELEIVVTNNQILIKDANVHFYSRLLDGTYPDVERIIPSQHKTEMTISRQMLLQAVERASLLGTDTKHVIKLESLAETHLQISSTAPEVGRVSEELAIHSFNGEQLKIAFTSKYVLDALRAMDAETLYFRYTGPMSAFILQPTEDENTLHLILPVRTYDR